MLICVSACGKKDDAAPTPILSAPAITEKVPAQAAVKASSGPVELTFLVHKTELKVGEYIWQQIRIRNISNKNIFTGDLTFDNPRELQKQSRSKYGIHIEALGSDGKPLDVKYQEPADLGSDFNYGVSGLLEVEGPEEEAMVDRWTKQGLSLVAINTKLIKFNTKKMRAAKKNDEWSGIELLPGQSAETKSAFFYSYRDKALKRPKPRPIGDFSQVDFFEFDVPGTYRIRAIYDRAPTPELNKMRGKLPISPEEVLAITPWVQITVTP